MALDRSEVSKEIDHIDTGGSATFKTMFFQDICLGWSLSDTPFSNKILISMMQVLYLLYFNFAVGLPLKLKLDSLAHFTPAHGPSYIKVFEIYFRFISQRRLALSEPEPECHGTVVPQYVG